jgi:hypothetical protein
MLETLVRAIEDRPNGGVHIVEVPQILDSRA